MRKMNLLLPIILGLAVVNMWALASTSVFAQTTVTTDAPTVISLGTVAGEVLKWIAAAFAGVLGLVGSAALLRFFKLLGVQVTDAMKTQLQGIIVNGINAGAANAALRLKGQGPVAIKNATVQDALAYTQQHGAEVIKGLGLDPQSGEAVEAIKARIETAIADPKTPTNPIVTPTPLEPTTKPGD